MSDDSSTTAPSLSENDLKVPMGAVPALAGLAIIASLMDWSLGRGWLRALGASNTDLPHTTLLQLQQVALLVRNLAASSGLVALFLSFHGWIRHRPATTPRSPTTVPLLIRMSVAGFAGILFPTLVLSTILPSDRTTQLIVLFASATAHILTLVVGLGCLLWAAPRLARLGHTLIAAASFFAFGGFVLLIIGQHTLWNYGHSLGMALRRTGEVSYMVALLVLPLSLRPWRALRGKINVAIGLTLGMAALLAWGSFWATHEPATFSNLFYGQTHLEVFIASEPRIYLVWLAAAFTAGVATALHPDSVVRQTGLGVLALLAAGYAPTTPSTLLMWTLGAFLCSRGLVARAIRSEAVAIVGSATPSVN